MKTVLHTLGALLLVPATLLAQGTLIITNEVVRLPRPVPQPPQTTYHLETLEMNSKVMGQIADVQVSQTFVNSGKRTIEAQLVFPLPYDGAIDKMTLMVNGTELEAKLLSADEAKARYQSIVRANKDPALLEWIGTGMFQTSVFPIPPGEKRTVTLHYTQLLRKDHGLTDFLYPLRTAKFTSRPLSKLSMRVVIEAPADIKNIYSPSHAVDIDRSGERHAVVTFEQQNVVPSEDFRLLFDTKEGKIGATVLTYRPDKSEEGYFLLLASPRVKSGDGEPQAKTISFVVDKSGSMSGEKIEQAREAAKFVLNNLRKGDLFNIISYDSSVQAFRPELESFTSESRASGLAYVDGLYAGGGTNIHDALLRSFQDLQDKKRPNYILFLTDGKPTSGVTGESLIAKAISEANGIKARLMAFGVGYDVNR
ncbi:MAG: VWA domain-containing protein, partial [Planctomycetaceae bacterium]|nr:VWA domain-containing protein [Planctomycetaceae bacterium]